MTELIPNENKQGFQGEQDWPQGLIARVQPQKAHRSFVRNNPSLDTIMLQMDDAETLLNTGRTAPSYFGDDVSLITSSTIHDTPLGKFRWTREEDIVRANGSDFHIPTDYWVYGDMEPEDRISNIHSMMDGTLWFARRTSDTNTQTVPLITGTNPEERAICFETMEELGIPYGAVYGAQFFGGKMGNGINRLNHYIRDIVSEYPLEGILLIGLQSTDYLDRLPPEVVAAAGQRWIYESGLRDVPLEQAIHRFGGWKPAAEGQLGRGIATLGSFGNTSVTGVTA